MSINEWSDSVAGLAVDALVDHGLIQRADFDRAAKIVSKEIVVRLCLRDYPPPEDPKIENKNA